MKFYFPTIVFLLLVSFPARAQTNSPFVADTTEDWRVEVQKKDGEWHGRAKYYDKKTGILIAEFTYENGDRTGPGTLYDHETGCKDSYGSYIKEAKVGDWTYLEDCSDEIRGTVHYEFSSDSGYTVGYYPSGNIRREGQIKDDELDGVWKQYYDAPGRLEKVSNKCFSKDNGEAVFYDSLTQKIVAKGSYKCDEKSGVWEYFDAETSVLIAVEHFNNKGEFDGPYIKYYVSGKKKEEGFYKEGLAQGTCKFYDSATGNMIKVDNYVNDTLDGKSQWFYPSGQLESDGTYKRGIKVGFWTGYYEDGKTHFTAEHDKLTENVLLKYYATNGTLTFTGKANGKAKDGEWRYYDMEGRGELVKVEEYKNGLLDGETTFYYPGKKIRVKGGHKDGAVHGKWKRYYPSGKLWISMEYDHTKIVGELKSYYENGQLRRKEKYEDGNMLSSTCYSEDGKEIVYTDIFTPAEYDGDLEAYYHEHMVYPDVPLEDDDNGEVVVPVRIEDNGEIVVGDAISTAPKEYDDEAIRLVKAMKKWKPAMLDGFPINVNRSIVVPFKEKK